MSTPPTTEIALPTMYTSECRAMSAPEERLLVNGYRDYVHGGDTGVTTRHIRSTPKVRFVLAV